MRELISNRSRIYASSAEPCWAFGLRGEDGAEPSAESKTLELDIYDRIGESFWFDSVSAKSVRSLLKSNKKAETIKVRINSRGGDVIDGSAIYTLLAEHDAQVIVNIDGIAASMASVIAMAGDEITMSSAAYLMVHNPWGIGMGEASDLRNLADTLDKMRGTLASIYAGKSGQSLEQIYAWMDAETWMTATEAKERGFVDLVQKPKRSAAKQSKDASARAYASLAMGLDAYGNMPEALRAYAQAAGFEQRKQIIGAEKTSINSDEGGEYDPATLPRIETKTTAGLKPAPENKNMSDKTLEKNLETATPAILRALGLPMGSTEQDAIACSARMRELELQVMAITGAPTSGEALGAVRALSANAAEATRLREDNCKLRGERDSQNFESQLSRGAAERKITPAENKFWRGRFDAAVAENRGELLVEELKGFLDVTTTRFDIPKSPPAPKTAGNGGGSAVALTYNGKSYSQMRPRERAALAEVDAELWKAMKQEWEDAGRPAASAA